MKKLLFVINTLGGAGAEAALLSLISCIDPQFYDISLYVLTNQGELRKRLPDYVHLLNKAYDETSVLNEEGKRHLKRNVLKRIFRNGAVFRDSRYILKNLIQMVKNKRFMPDKLLWRVLSDSAEVFDTEYDLAISYIEGGSAYYVADHVRSKKKAAFIHISYENAGYTRALDQDAYEAFSTIYCVSDEVKKDFECFYPEHREKTKVFHNIIDIQKILEKAEEVGGFNDSYDGMRVLTVGRLTCQKAYEYSIEAMKYIKDSGVKVRWYVLGEGEERAKLEGQIIKLGLKDDFILLGATDNPYPYYKQTDLYVHASRFEGKSIAIQEAKILGCPIIVSDCAGNREQVTNGKNGLIVDLDSRKLADSILMLIRDAELRKKFSNAVKSENMSNIDQVTELLSLAGD